MRIALAVGGVALVALAGYLIWQPTRSDADRLESMFDDATGCSEGSGTLSQETLPEARLRDYMRDMEIYDGRSFATYVTRAEPELTLISCQVGGGTVRYFVFDSDRDAQGVIAHHRGDLCLDGNVIIDLDGRHLPTYCDELGGEMKSSPRSGDVHLTLDELKATMDD